MSKQTCSSTSQNIFTSRKIILELMESRGYNIDEYKNIGINEVHIMMQNKQLDLLLEKSDQKVFIKYNLAKSIRDKDIYELIEDLFVNEEVLTKKDDLIIIIKDDPNDTLVNTIKYIWDTEQYNVTIFNIKKLQFNILKHAYVPPHRILTKKEEEDFKKKFNVTDNSQMPEISRFDPVAMAIGLRKNQICEIKRNSKTAIVKNFYRICC